MGYSWKSSLILSWNKVDETASVIIAQLWNDRFWSSMWYSSFTNKTISSHGGMFDQPAMHGHEWKVTSVYIAMTRCDI